MKSKATTVDERVAELSAEAKRRRLELRAAERRIAELEAQLKEKGRGADTDVEDETDPDEPTGGDADEAEDDADPTDAPDAEALRIENLFMRSVLARSGSLDTETAWTLMRERGFLDAVNPDEPETMDAALDKVVDRYPWLADEAEASAVEPPPLPPSGGRARKVKDSHRVTDNAGLANRFPALRGR